MSRLYIVRDKDFDGRATMMPKFEMQRHLMPRLIYAAIERRAASASGGRAISGQSTACRFIYRPTVMASMLPAAARHHHAFETPSG